MNDRPAAGGSVPFIDAAAVRRLSPMPALIQALRRAFAAGADMPPRTAHQLPQGGALLVMPAWAPGLLGVKIATVFPLARPAVAGTYLLIDSATGQLKAVIDGAMLTARRTAAASALAAERLAREDVCTLLLVGTGALSAHLIEAHAAVRPIRKILVWGRHPGRAEAVAAAARQPGLAATCVASLDEAVAQADIISCATLASRPLIAGALLRPGTHLDLVGAFTPDMAEADPRAFARARLFVDTREGALAEAGDLLQAIAAGAIRADDIEADLAALSSGAHAGRGADREAITLFKSVGVAIEDLAAAQLVFEAWHAR